MRFPLRTGCLPLTGPGDLPPPSGRLAPTSCLLNAPGNTAILRCEAPRPAVSTGQDARRRTASATLPIMALWMPRLPASHGVDAFRSNLIRVPAKTGLMFVRTCTLRGCGDRSISSGAHSGTGDARPRSGAPRCVTRRDKSRSSIKQTSMGCAKRPTGIVASL